MGEDAWRLRDVSVMRGTSLVLTGMDLAIPAAQITTVIGPSQAGKSSLLMLLAGRIPATSGSFEATIDPQGVTLHNQAWRSSQGDGRLADIATLADDSTIAVLLDEPEKGLDEKSIAQIRRHLQQRADEGVTIVIATHEYSWVRDHSPQTVLVEAGTARMTAVAGIDFLALQHATLEQLRQTSPGHKPQ